MLTQGHQTVHRPFTTGLTGKLRRQIGDEIATQRTLAGAEPKHVRNMHETCGATADPVGILLGETLHTGNDQAAFGGVVRHVSGEIAATPSQLLGLLERETVPAHQHLHVTVITEAHDHADARQVVADPLAHADAVGALVTRRWFLEVVVKTVQSTDEGVVATDVSVSQLAVAEIDAAVVSDPDEGPLPGGRAVATFPDTAAEFEIPERDRDLAAAAVDMPFIHRAGDVGERGAVLERIALPIPAFQQAEPHPTRIEVEGVDLVIGDVVERFAIPTAVALQALSLRQQGSGWRGRSDRDQTTDHNNRRQQQGPTCLQQRSDPDGRAPEATTEQGRRPLRHAAGRSWF